MTEVVKNVTEDVEIAVHKLVGDGRIAESATLFPGQEIPLDDLAEYERKSISAGRVQGLEVSSSEPKKTQSKKATKEVSEEPEAKSDTE